MVLCWRSVVWYKIKIEFILTDDEILVDEELRNEVYHVHAVKK